MQTPAMIGRVPVLFSPLRRRALGALGFATLLFVGGLTLNAQAPSRPDDPRRGGPDNQRSPQDMQARLLSAMRERLDVPNDDEWAIISDRLMKVFELRRADMSSGLGGFMFGRGGDSRGGDRGGDRSRSSRSSGNTDVAALQAAIQDKLPDAEIKARLDRVRELRKDNEAKLAKAQEDLRAVLTVRQEAVLVLAGMLR